MTKKSIIDTETPKAAPRRKFRKLTKAEEEEYTREMNKILAKISEGIQKGEIQAPWWRQNP